MYSTVDYEVIKWCTNSKGGNLIHSQRYISDSIFEDPDVGECISVVDSLFVTSDLSQEPETRHSTLTASESSSLV